MRTIDQQLLAKAHEKVKDAAAKEKGYKDKYRTAIKGAPAFIQGCGLAQAVAYWQDKAGGNGDEGSAYRDLLLHLESFPGLENLRAKAATEEVAGYVFLTQRTQDALVFLKRMVDALIPREKNQDA